VLRTVRAYSDANQHPEVRWPHADVVSGAMFRPDEPVFDLRWVPASSSQPLTMSQSTSSPPKDGEARLRILGDAAMAAAVGRSIKRATIVGANEQADVVWDSEQHRALDRLGSVIASDVTASELQAVVDSAVALNAIRHLVAESGVDMRLLLPGETLDSAPSRASDRTHREGTRLTLVASGLRHPYFVLFNLAGNGTVQFLFPIGKRKDAETIDTGQPYTLPLDVTSPFGADHAVCVSSAVAPTDLIATLNGVNDQKAPFSVIEALTALAKMPNVQVGMQGIFTARK
jgi:hypothetical protein